MSVWDGGSECGRGMHLSILDGLPADRRVLDGAAQQLARSDALDDHAPEMLTRISPMSVNGTLQVPVGLAVFLDATPYIPDELALGVHTHLFARTPSRILGVRHPKPNLGGAAPQAESWGWRHSQVTGPSVKRARVHGRGKRVTMTLDRVIAGRWVAGVTMEARGCNRTSFSRHPTPVGGPGPPPPNLHMRLRFLT